MAKLTLIIDTNSLLHFNRPDHVDWKTVAGEQDVEIVLVAPVLAEIDKHKNQHPNPRTKDRARDLSAWIRQLRRAPAQSGVPVLFHLREPTLFPEGLDPSVSDDRIVATGLQLAGEGKSVAVVTDDTLLGLKAEAAQLREINLPDSERLKVTPDPLKAENVKLQNRITALEAREPKLALMLASKTGLLELKIPPLRTAGVKTPQEIRGMHPPINTKEGGSPASLAAFTSYGISDAQIERYNEDLSKYYAEYDSYYEKNIAVLDVIRRAWTFEFVLDNRGTATATNVRATIDFPSPRLRVLKKLPPLQQVPQAPTRPGPYEFASLRDSEARRAQLADSIRPYFGDPTPISDVRVRVDTNRATLIAPRLQHGSTWRFDPVLVLIDKALIGSAVDVDMTIAADELPQPILQRFTFRIREESALN